MQSTAKANLLNTLQELRHLTHRKFLSAETTNLLCKWLEDDLILAAKNGFSQKSINVREAYAQLGLQGDALTEGEIDYICRFILNWSKEQGLSLVQSQETKPENIVLSWHSE